MPGSRQQKIISSFYCINCGKCGIPVWRNKSSLHKNGHRKALYCVNCKQTINHVEVRTDEEKKRFMDDFAAGKFIDEAEESIAFSKEHYGRGG